MTIGCYSTNDYWLLFYKWLLVVILQMTIGGYCINGYWWIFYWWIFVATLFWENVRMRLTLPKWGFGSPLGPPKTSKFDCRGQNTLHWDVLYIIRKLSKCRCQKWACMSHLDICSITYGKKKRWESNWQFDSRPPKIENRPNPDACRRSATHHWKTLDESYNYASNCPNWRCE
jgi:hypothetical protein